jgi:hypothetical protein
MEPISLSLEGTCFGLFEGKHVLVSKPSHQLIYLIIQIPIRHSILIPSHY